MFRFIAILSFLVAFLVSTASYSATRRTPEGKKYKPYSKFNFLINNNQVSSASVYKRYVAYNKRQEAKGKITAKQVAKRSAKQKSAPKPKSTTVKGNLLAAK